MKAFVLVSLKNGNEKEVLKEVKKLPSVKNAFILFGAWDLLLETESSSSEELGTFVMDQLRAHPNVRLTSSLIVAGK